MYVVSSTRPPRSLPHDSVRRATKLVPGSNSFRHERCVDIRHRRGWLYEHALTPLMPVYHIAWRQSAVLCVRKHGYENLLLQQSLLCLVLHSDAAMGGTGRRVHRYEGNPPPPPANIDTSTSTKGPCRCRTCSGPFFRPGILYVGTRPLSCWPLCAWLVAVASTSVAATQRSMLPCYDCCCVLCFFSNIYTR